MAGLAHVRISIGGKKWQDRSGGHEFLPFCSLVHPAKLKLSNEPGQGLQEKKAHHAVQFLVDFFGQSTPLLVHLVYSTTFLLQ